MKINIAIITGTRAEYGLLKPLISALNKETNVNLQLLVTGMHLSELHGNTIEEIETDGFHITAKVNSHINNDSAIGISTSIAHTIKGFSEIFKTLNTDLIMVLGDRSEIFAVATAATVKGIPIAHIHGGETTEGAYDEAFRHAITKMSHWHLTSTEVYRKRVIQLGEQPNSVFNVGAIGIDSIINLDLMSMSEFENSIDFKLNKKNILITFHPVTLEKNTSEVQFKDLLSALDDLEDATLIFTKPNSDKDGNIIIKLIDDYVSKHKYKSVAFTSLGQLRYLSALQYMDVVVGNSSSGIVEVPLFKKPTINIGDRQKGRLMPASVINCEPNKTAIKEALEKSFSAAFLNSIKNLPNAYGNGTATQQILDIILNQPIPSIKKSFFDLN
ncbi:UDP-N-acetylglucosamine 2-epimerase [Winogradskyella sp. UBA3174]|uniref:UDP-N-acetylglucosamine 2-epimerase n=1 Tax=Winogradskyella sp. UBA3174 TaxID=1947785 RepID=UPI0025DA0E23|nr:UDP-N-acetylglucosamine 2-epimerase [Winogradskyella sp. UBA3174]|tara:strand:+ start:28099 stop:29256 length:1158 start_codon:yes stop_codon:yes gene_type:complete